MEKLFYLLSLRSHVLFLLKLGSGFFPHRLTEILLGNVINSLTVGKSNQYFVNFLFLFLLHYITLPWFSSYICFLQLSFTCSFFSTPPLNIEVVQGVSPGPLLLSIWKLSHRFKYCLYRNVNMFCRNQFSELLTYIFD